MGENRLICNHTIKMNNCILFLNITSQRFIYAFYIQLFDNNICHCISSILKKKQKVVFQFFVGPVNTI